MLKAIPRGGGAGGGAVHSRPRPFPHLHMEPNLPLLFRQCIYEKPKKQHCDSVLPQDLKTTRALDLTQMQLVPVIAGWSLVCDRMGCVVPLDVSVHCRGRSHRTASTRDPRLRPVLDRVVRHIFGRSTQH